MAAAASRQRRQMSAVRTRIEISDDRRSHSLVLLTLPEANLVTPKVLLTGRPGCGKTTLVKRIVNEVVLPAGGFYTVEIREGRERVGFKIITLDDQEAVLAHV